MYLTVLSNSSHQIEHVKIQCTKYQLCCIQYQDAVNANVYGAWFSFERCLHTVLYMLLDLHAQLCQYLKYCVCMHQHVLASICLYSMVIAWGKGSNCVTREGVGLWRSFVARGGRMSSVRWKRSWWLLCPWRSNWEMDALGTYNFIIIIDKFARPHHQ